MYIYIQSRTFPPRKRPRERILHEKVSRVLLLLLILFKSWGCAPKCSLWSASGEGSSLASDAVSRGDGDVFGGSHVTMSLTTPEERGTPSLLPQCTGPASKPQTSC